MKHPSITKLSNKDFASVIKNTPLISIDLIITNANNKVLLALRNNKPAQNYWFVPGGRILKNEPVQDLYTQLTLKARENLKNIPNLSVLKFFFYASQH